MSYQSASAVAHQCEGQSTGPNEWKARCPVPGHGQGRGDQNPSLSIWEKPDGRVFLKCWVGCATEDVVAALGLSMADLFPPKKFAKPAQPKQLIGVAAPPTPLGGQPHGVAGILIPAPSANGQQSKATSSAALVPTVVQPAPAPAGSQPHVTGIVLVHAQQANGNSPTTGGGLSHVWQHIATYDYGDEHGHLLYQVVRQERIDPTTGKRAKECPQRRRPRPGEKAKVDHKGWVWNMHGVDRVLYRLSPVRKGVKEGKTIWLVEGEKDADNLAKLGLVTTTAPGGSDAKWFPSYTEALLGAPLVVVIADNDQPGYKHANKVARALTTAGIPFRVIVVPVGNDASDWIEAGATKADFEALAAQAGPWQPPPPPVVALASGQAAVDDGRPAIVIDVDEERVVAEAIVALAGDPDIYQRGDRLVWLLSDPEQRKDGIVREPGAPRVGDIPRPWVQLYLAKAARWLTLDGEDLVPAHPPRFAVAAVESACRWKGIRRLMGVTETPVCRADGSILATPGYDEATGLLYISLGQAPSVPESPTRQDAESALKSLLEVVADFPFEMEEHKATWVAAVLTPLLRWAFGGPTPLFVFDANVRGAGKSLLARLAALIAYGRIPATMTLPADEEERRKRITALAREADPLVLLDNVEGVLGGSSLNAVLTATEWKDRILGVSQSTGTLPLFAIWYVTGNNVTFGPDTTRRVVHIRLQSDREKPEERDGFAHDPLIDWVRKERRRLVEAALTIVRAYFVAGCPKTRLPAMGSFEGWSLVRQIVTWVGMPDPLKTQVVIAETADREKAELQVLHDALAVAIAGAGEPVTAQRILDAVACLAEIKAGLLEFCPGRNGELPTPIKLSGRLRHLKGRVLGGRAIDVERGRAGTSRWTLRTVGSVVMPQKVEVVLPSVGPGDELIDIDEILGSGSSMANGHAY